jgi:hypothetical protein
MSMHPSLIKRAYNLPKMQKMASNFETFLMKIANENYLARKGE